MVDFGVCFKRDFDFGTKEEEIKLGLMREKFGEDVERTGKSCEMDYFSPNMWGELKSRNCFLNTYPTTMVGANKVKFAERSCRDCYFVFNFKDGVYYWKYNKDDIENGKVTFKMGGRYDRGRVERKEYAYIDTDILVKMI